METQDARDRSRRRERIVIVALWVSFGLIAIGVAGLVVWAVGREAPPPAVVSYEAYRPAWESAMAKAGVEATFPPAPVDVQDVRGTGMHAFSATFTAEEITALLAMYRFSYATASGPVSLQRALVSFPATGTAGVQGGLAFQGTSYGARATAPVAYDGGHVLIDAEHATLAVEGFTVDGERRAQALRMVASYLDAFLDAIPRVTIGRAEIVEGGVAVEGTAPQRVEHPGAEPTE